MLIETTQSENYPEQNNEICMALMWYIGASLEQIYHPYPRNEFRMAWYS